MLNTISYGKKNNIASYYTFSVVALVAFICLPASGNEQLDEIEFDTGPLKSSGFDPNVAKMFRHAARFLPGPSTVTFMINGEFRGKHDVRFDDRGNLCANKALFQAVGLSTPKKLLDGDECIDLANAWPQSELYLNSAQQRIELVLPAQYVFAQSSERPKWSHGGSAGLLNYDLQHVESSSDSSSLSFTRADTEAGVNLDDWIVRSRQTYSQFNGNSLIQHQAAFAQRSFIESKKILQVGQINLSNSMFGTGQVYGFQIVPELALLSENDGPGLVNGIADSQSVVEIRQSGALVYSTTVPAGPFQLKGFPLLNTRSDLEVMVTGVDGSKRNFVVPSSSLVRYRKSSPTGLSFGVGRLNQEGSSESPVLATAARGWQLTPYINFNAGVLGSDPYRAGGIGVESQLFDSTLMSFQSTVMQDYRHGSNGIAATMTLDHNLSERLSVSFNTSQRTQGYRELSDSLQDDQSVYDDAISSQIGGGVNWSSEDFGGFGMFWSQSDTFNDERTQYLRGSWSRMFSRTYIGFTVEHDTGTSYTEPESRFYLTVNIPFGGGESRRSNLNSYVNHTKSSSRVGTSFNQRLSQDRGFTLTGEKDLRTQRSSTTASGDLLTPFSQLSGSITSDSYDNRGWSGRASGAIVAHKNGIAFSPYHVKDTFGIAKVGEESNVKLSSPSGPVWTNGDGYAVLPSLQGFTRSTIQVETNSLPRNIDINNAWQSTEVARGSISNVAFDVVRTRRVMVTPKDSNGKVLKTGSSVFGEFGEFITVVDGKGGIFISDANAVKVFEVQSSGVTLCRFKLSLPEQADNEALYETTSATCN